MGAATGVNEFSIEATARRDGGFEIPMFIRQLEQVNRIEPERFAEYGVDEHDHAALTVRFLAWADELRSSTEATPGGTAATDPRVERRDRSG